jgi:hypothetical protein
VNIYIAYRVTCAAIAAGFKNDSRTLHGVYIKVEREYGSLFNWLGYDTLHSCFYGVRGIDWYGDVFEWHENKVKASLLAWALLADAFDDVVLANAWRYKFGARFVSKLPIDGWVLTSEDVKSAFNKMKSDLEREQRHARALHQQATGRATRPLPARDEHRKRDD